MLLQNNNNNNSNDDDYDNNSIYIFISLPMLFYLAFEIKVVKWKS